MVFSQKFRLVSGWLRVVRGGSGAKAPPLAARPFMANPQKQFTMFVGHESSG